MLVMVARGAGLQSNLSTEKSFKFCVLGPLRQWRPTNENQGDGLSS